MIRTLSRVAAMATILTSASIASAGSVSSWNVGSGQTNDNFQVASGTVGGATVELGLRAQLRTLGSIVPSGSVYYVQPGTQFDNPSFVRWNFDYSMISSGSLSSFDELKLEITSSNANTPANGGLIDFAAILNVNGNPNVSTIQDSANPFFSYAFGPGFNPNLPGTYTFKLTAGNTAFSTDSVSTTMQVTVVPTPMALPGGLAMLGGGLLITKLRRKQTV